MLQKVEKVHRGGVSKKHQKVQNSEFDMFSKRGGEAIFSFFSPIQMFTLDTSVEEKVIFRQF